MPQLHESGPFQSSYGQPRETTQHLLGPIIISYFRPTKFTTHYVAPQFFIFRRRVPVRVMVEVFFSAPGRLDIYICLILFSSARWYM